MYLKKETFLIVGLAKSGLSCAKFLLSNNAKCYLYEENLNVKQTNSIQLQELGGEFVEKDELEEVLEKISILVLSPGVPIDSYIPKKARSLGKRIIGELELGLEFINSPYIAITGTNGKTTCTYLLEHMLNKTGIMSYAVGNVGVPITSMVGSVNKDNLLVAEVSSFQLETCNRILPHIALILNITPDHLSRHYTMENYAYLKCKLLNNLRESEYAVLNFDDEIVKEFSKKTRGKVYYFSLKEKVNGAYVYQDKIYFKEEELFSVSDIKFKGNHNLSNILACITVCKILGVENDIILGSITTFKGAKHRLELVKEIKGVSYYNDSKSTNPDSTIKAIESMDKDTILLLGGKDKQVDYKSMLSIAKNSIVKEIVLFGEIRYKMYEDAKSVGLTNIHITNNLKNAFALTQSLITGSCNVLLSPACSSFDSYVNYEERGEEFISLVESII